MLRVGLTGGIAAGKSTVSGRLAERGAVLIDSDRIAREVLEPGTEGLAEVVAEFGAEVLTADGALDRPALARRVFGDERARAALNAIVHPRVGARAAELVAQAPADAVLVHDVPLLVENGMETGFHLVVVVHAEAGERVRRLVEQRGMAERDARARIDAQADDEQRRAAADVWLDNSGEPGAVLPAVDRLWSDRLVPFEKNLRLGRRAPRPPNAVVVPPDDTWRQQAERVRARVAAAAGERARRIDHIGSTAVPGLDAKDVLDLQVVVADLAVAEGLADDLVDAGLVRLRGHWLDNAMNGTQRDKAFATNADPARAVNCHLRPEGSPTWREAVLLRDWLRVHPEGVREYAAVKHDLAAQQLGSIDAYADAKTPFLRSALSRAETWAIDTSWSP